MAAPDPDKGPIGSSYGSKGLGGALKDLGRAIMGTGKDSSGIGGRRREQTIMDTVDEATLGRMRAAQSSDKDNSNAY